VRKVRRVTRRANDDDTLISPGGRGSFFKEQWGERAAQESSCIGRETKREVEEWREERDAAAAATEEEEEEEDDDDDDDDDDEDDDEVFSAH